VYRQVTEIKAMTSWVKDRKWSGVLYCSLWFLLLISSSGLLAQDQELQVSAPVDADEEVLTVTLPDSPQLAMRLATPGTRNKALLDLATAVNLLSRTELDPVAEQAVLVQHFLDDRAWLQLLVDRYGWVGPHSAVLDPAAWLVVEELQQHAIEDMALVFPGQMPKTVLTHQVFQRAGERLAAANLPILLLDVEPNVIATWDAFIQLASSEGLIDPAWQAVESAWFSDHQSLQPPLMDDDAEALTSVVEDGLKTMLELVSSTVTAGPPDASDLLRIRYSLLASMPELDAENKARALDVLYLSSLIDGLQDGRYIDFTVGLLSVTSRLLGSPESTQVTLSLVEWLVSELPAISALYAVDFARVDPRLNTVIATTHSVLRDIALADEKAIDITAARIKLADAVAQLAMLIPDMAYYFDTPVRAKIIEEVNICISIAVGLSEDGFLSMTRNQFDACMATLLQLAEEETRSAELSGNINGPFTADALRRELSVTPWQRINYAIGYLHEHYSTACQAPATALPNPLEWAVLANTMAWFAESAPVYFQTPENETRLTAMRTIGEQLILSLAEQTACLSASGAGINDPVSRGLTDYELALRVLNKGIDDAEADFRSQRLSPGADALLQGDAQQQTGYRPDDLVIEPCDKQAVCEMSGSLSTTRALIGLFPNEYLIAEQTGLGRIEICYRNMEWVQRRSELVRPDDENVANYFGHLSFDLVGRYVEKDQGSEIFGFRFTSPQEHHYLFAQTSDEVLNDSCPVEWVGTRVVTPLRVNHNGIVPNRLTYLAAARKLPSRLLQSNWDRGAEWRDWFVTGIGVSTLKVSPAKEIITRLNQHLQSLYQAEQTDIYQRLLLPNLKNSDGDDISLFDEMSQVSIAKSLIRMQMMLFYPSSLTESDAIRMSIAGDDGLLEGRTLRRLREESIALTTVNDIARQRLDGLRSVWEKQAETMRRQGTVPTSLMHALTRINILYRQFFTARPEPLQKIDLGKVSEAEDG
jgi:hypothetical protein